jgi:hypothetical protein
MLPNQIEDYLEDILAEIERLQGLLDNAKLAGEKLELRAKIKAYQEKYAELNANK